MRHPFKPRPPRVLTPERGPKPRTPEDPWRLTDADHMRLDAFRHELATGDVADVVSYARKCLADDQTRPHPFWSAIVGELARRCEGMALDGFTKELMATVDTAEIAALRAELAEADDAAFAAGLDDMAAKFDHYPYVNVMLRECARRVGSRRDLMA